MILIVRIALSLVLLAASWKVFHQLAALQVHRVMPGIQGLREALRWDPQGPEYHFQLGVLYRDQIERQDLGLAQTHLEKAVKLNPFGWQYWLELGRYYEFSELNDRAENAYLQAVRLNPRSAAYRWLLANFYLRRGNWEKSFPQLKASIEQDRLYRQPALALLWKLGTAKEEIDRLWPQDRESRIVLLQFLTGKGYDPDFIQTQWDKVQQNSLPGFSVTEGAFYIRYLLEHNRRGEARTQWLRLVKLNGVEEKAYRNKQNYIWNGDFEVPFLGGILDWKLPSSEAFSIACVEKQGVDGSKGLKIDFHGIKNIDFGGLKQEVLVEPQGAYEFSFYARSQAISTEQGLYFEIRDGATNTLLLETRPVLDTTPWTRYSATVQVPSGAQSVWIELRRKPSRRIDNLLRGSLWLDLLLLKRSVDLKR